MDLQGQVQRFIKQSKQNETDMHWSSYDTLFVIAIGSKLAKLMEWTWLFLTGVPSQRYRTSEDTGSSEGTILTFNFGKGLLLGHHDHTPVNICSFFLPFLQLAKKNSIA